MKVYLDDIRKEPEGWVRTYTAREAIQLLKSNKVTDISLDHDLGDEDATLCGNGYDVICWLELAIAHGIVTTIPNMAVHSSNPSGILKINQAISSINKRFR